MRISDFFFDNFSYALLITIAVAIAIGIVASGKERPEKQMRQYFNDLFRNANTKEHDDSLPYYMKNEDVSEYINIVSIMTLILTYIKKFRAV